MSFAAAGARALTLVPKPVHRFRYPLAFFTVGLAAEAYTGATVVKEYDTSTGSKVLVKKTRTYSYMQGTGLGWGIFFAILAL
jgi:hypothetical protein